MHVKILLIASLLVATAASFGVANAQGGSASFNFDAQNSGGHSVIIKSASLPQGGFMTIHDATLLSSADPLKSVIGVSDFLAAGDHQNVRVYLMRALKGDNETLIAMPHKDSNGNHIYDFVSSAGSDDGPYTGGPQALSGLTGNMAGFNGVSATPKQVNNTAYIESAAQVQSGKGVIVSFVDLSQDGYVALHDATLVTNPGANGINGGNLFSSVVGVSAKLTAGVHWDVVIGLAQNCGGCTQHDAISGTIIPMAHKETNGNSAYDFITSQGANDGPFVGQPGTPLTAVINVIDVHNDASQGPRTVFQAQATGGHLVLVPEVFLPDGGFVAVHDSTLLSNADPLKSVRGVSDFLTPGIHRNVTVELSTAKTGAQNGALTGSDTLIAMPHKDTNGNKQYDFVTSSGADDGPYTGGPNALSGLTGSLSGFNGVSSVVANATLGAGVLVTENQFSTDGKSVKLAYADLSAPGFIALHDESLLANVGANVLTSVVGVSDLLQPGLHRDVTIAIGNNCAGCVKTHALNTSQTLIAMPHKDTNANGKYDFVSSSGADDRPFTGANGNSNVVTASNIVVSVGRLTTPVQGAAGPSPTPTSTTPTPTSTTPASTTPGGSTSSAPTNDAASTKPSPGFEVVLVAAAIGLSLIVLRRRA